MKDKFLRKKVTDYKIWEKNSFGSLRRDLSVSVETGIPVYETANGETKDGLPQVDFVFCRGTGKLSMTVEEAMEVADAISFLRPVAQEMTEKCKVERAKTIKERKRK